MTEQHPADRKNPDAQDWRPELTPEQEAFARRAYEGQFAVLSMNLSMVAAQGDDVLTSILITETLRATVGVVYENRRAAGASVEGLSAALEGVVRETISILMANDPRDGLGGAAGRG